MYFVRKFFNLKYDIYLRVKCVPVAFGRLVDQYYHVGAPITPLRALLTHTPFAQLLSHIRCSLLRIIMTMEL